MSGAALMGQMELSEGFAWIGSYPALIAFVIATVLEIAAYYVPWLDNLLDTMTTPTAVVAGTVVTASCVTEMSPLLKWTLAVIAGGGAAGIVQGSTSLLRLASTSLTGGLANWIVSTLETIGAVLVSILAVVVPIIAVSAAALLAVFLIWWLWRRRRKTELAVNG